MYLIIIFVLQIKNKNHKETFGPRMVKNLLNSSINLVFVT